MIRAAERPACALQEKSKYQASKVQLEGLGARPTPKEGGVIRPSSRAERQID